jgi:putative redox protein
MGAARGPSAVGRRAEHGFTNALQTFLYCGAAWVDSMQKPEPIMVAWAGERRFRGGRAGGPQLVLDCAREAAPGPVDALLIALASCAAVDVLAILKKRRTPAAALRVEIAHERAAAAPRRLVRVHLRFVIVTASHVRHVERAVALATASYCSVAASLAPDIPLTHEVVVQDADDVRQPGHSS